MLDISFIELIKTFKTMNERLKRILLWIAVIPGAIIAGILILFPVHWVLYQTLTNFIDPYPEAPEKILGPLATAWAMVKTAAYIAPSHKKYVAIVMTVHWVFIAGGGFALSYFELDIGTGRLNLYAGGLPIVGGIVGSIIALLSELNDKEQIE
jgi:hypothetical protein